MNISPAPSTQVRSGRGCQAVTRAGSGCRNNASHGSDFCFFHDPKLAEERKHAQRLGGSRSQRQFLPPDTSDVDLKTPEDVRILISDTVSRLRRGELEPKVCSTIGYLAQVGLKSIEQGDLEERIRRMEETLDITR